MTPNTRITVSCTDRVGLVSDITGRLFDIGANLGATSFALDHGRASFATSCELPDTCPLAECETALRELPMEKAEITVEAMPETAPLTSAPGATHLIECSGVDQPGLIARLSEIFIEYHANIVQLSASASSEKDTRVYTARFAVTIPTDRAANCLATLANTAGSLRLVFRFVEL
ncbi:MAG: hypothetical protein ABID63_09210 [Pseudomonadota bacterium]